MQQSGQDDIATLARRIATLTPAGPRVLVAIAGPPGAGKSTLSEQLAARLPGAAVVPMDGFHLDNRILQARGILARKGAPETFDAAGFICAMRRMRSETEVVLPVFDRSRDIAIAGAKVVDASHRIALIEGNYLLLDARPWDALADLWDLTVSITVQRDELEKRLVQRWLDHGLDAQSARTRAHGNDLANAKLMMAGSRQADLSIEL